jgi:hypothetical protein
MTDIISSDNPLNVEQQSTLTALLDTLVPASDDGSMPSAAEVDFGAYLRTQAPEFLPDLTTTLDELGPAFAALEPDERYEQVSRFSSAEPRRFQALLTRVYDCYYQDDRVRVAIGVATGAPFPQGNQVTPGDLSLLDPVIEAASRHQYRRT